MVFIIFKEKNVDKEKEIVLENKRRCSFSSLKLNFKGIRYGIQLVHVFLHFIIAFYTNNSSKRLSNVLWLKNVFNSPTKLPIFVTFLGIFFAAMKL